MDDDSGRGHLFIIRVERSMKIVWLLSVFVLCVMCSGAEAFAEDEDPEANIATLCRLVIEGKRDSVALFVSFPLRANYAPARFRSIRNADALRKRWKRIFTPQMLRAIRESMSEKPWRDEYEYSFGYGAVWFNEEGRLTAVNLSDDSPWRRRVEK
jgi:hypothetical protein